MSTPVSPAVREVASQLLSTLDRKIDNKIREMLDAKVAPAFIGREGKWIVKSRITGREREMEYSLTRLAYVAAHVKKLGGMPLAKEYGREVEYYKKAISEGSSTSGGSLIPQEWSDFVIPELGARIVVMKAGPTVLPMAHQVMNIPGLTNTGAFSWIGENASIATDATPTTNNTALTLHTAAGFMGVSIQWLRDASPETDAALQANLVRGISRFVDNGFLNGTGSSNQPTGMSNASGITSIFAGNGATNGSAILLDDISNAIYQLDLANAPTEGRAWFCHPRTMNELRLLRNTLGDPILWVNPADPLDMKLNGYPIYWTTQIPVNQSRGTASTCSYCLLVAMSDIYVGQGVRSQGLEVDISDQALFQNAEIAVRLLYRTDIQPGHAASIVSIGGIL